MSHPSSPLDAPFSFRFSRQFLRRRRGFTLLQILIVMGIIALLSALIFGVIGRVGEPARRAKCDVHLKQIALALATFRQERARMPKNLDELVSEGFIAQDALLCPSDPSGGAQSSSALKNSYADYYVLREPRDGNDLPVLVCPFHEANGEHGLQAFKGGDNEQFAARPATLAAADIQGVVTITRPQSGVLPLPSGTATLALHGGDHIKTGSGSVTIRFFDSSTANIEANTELTVLQSYIDGQRGGSLYTLVRQFTGRCNYYVNPGNRFDVATPTATAGALGTRFTIDLNARVTSAAVPSPNVAPNDPHETVVTVTEHVVALTTLERTIWVEPKDGPVAAHDPKNRDKPRIPRGSQEESDQRARKALTATTDPAANDGGSDDDGNGNSGNSGNGNSGSGNGNGNSGNGNSGNGNNNSNSASGSN